MVVLLGCSGKEPTRPAASPQPAVDVPPPPPPPPVVPKAPEVVRKKAEMGVGDKGRGYGMGPVATPVAVYFSTRERIAFDIQIPEAMKLFKATEGRAPKTQKEFMEKIIKANSINLPTLSAGHRYVYDPKQEELMVEQPAPQ
jgi:hypothetical protein